MNLLSQKYRVLGKKGEGTFSEVLKCQVIKDGSYRACKKMKHTYDSVEEVNNLREIQAMRRLSQHPNVLELQEVLFDKKSGVLILVFELMDMNLYELIRGKRHYLPEPRAKNFMFQLLKAVNHLHRNGIFHRDVKPENILIKEDQLKLADFGSCCSTSSKQPYTEYISTRWYRAPECLLTDGFYNHKMDIWSVGCVFFEILSLHPLFPGSNEVDQISKIHDLLGSPDQDILKKFRRSRTIPYNFPYKNGTGIERLLNHVSTEAIHLIYLMCTYDPDERISAHQALKHAYFQDLRNGKNKENLKMKGDSVKAKLEPGDNDMSEAIIQLDSDTSSPFKAHFMEVTMYPTLPKAQSHPSQSLADRKYSKHRRVPESHFLPRMAMNASAFNPTFHTSNFPTSFNKVHAAGLARTQRLLKSNTQTSKKARYSQLALPSLDLLRF